MEKKNDFKPFISADKVLPEFTVTSVILGMILAVIFGGDPCDLKERFHP